jgi:hypothetical protein
MGNLPEEKATHRKGRRKEESKRKPSRNNYSDSSEDERRQKRKEYARNIIAQARVNNSRYAWREENYEDAEKEMGALCFTCRVRKTRVPKGFKLPLGGTRPTAMQSLQLHLTGAARSWLNTLPNDSIGSWGELENQFARNFCSMYKRPTSLEEVKSCV